LGTAEETKEGMDGLQTTHPEKVVWRVQAVKGGRKATHVFFPPYSGGFFSPPQNLRMSTTLEAGLPTADCTPGAIELVALEQGVDVGTVHRRLDAYTKYAALRDGAASRSIVFYSRDVPFESVLADGAAVGYDAVWRASVHFSWFHVLNCFEALVPLGRKALSSPSVIRVGLAAIVKSLQRSTVQAQRPRFVFTVGDALRLASQTMESGDSAGHAMHLSAALVVVAAWKCQRDALEQWQFRDLPADIVPEHWRLCAEPCDAMSTVFCNCILQPLPTPALATVRSRVLNAAYAFHCVTRHAEEWDVHFHAMHDKWPSIEMYVQQLLAKNAEPVVDTKAWGLVPAAQMAPHLFGYWQVSTDVLERVDFWETLGGCRAKLSVPGDWCWMVVAAYAAYYPATDCSLNDVCAVLSGVQSDSRALDDATRALRTPVSWQDVFVPWHLSSVVGAAGDGISAAGGVSADDVSVSAVAGISAAGSVSADDVSVSAVPGHRRQASPFAMPGLHVLNVWFCLVSHMGSRPLIVLDGVMPAEDRRFQLPTFAPSGELSKRSRVCRNLRRLDKLMHVLNEKDPVKMVVAAAVLADPCLEDAWEFGDCAERFWLRKAVADAVERSATGATGATSAFQRSLWPGAMLWWWMMQPGRAPEEWPREFLPALLEAATRWPQYRFLITWGVFARVWLFAHTQFAQTVLEKHHSGALSVDRALSFEGAQIVCDPVADHGPWRVVGCEQWTAYNLKADAGPALDAAQQLNWEAHSSVVYAFWEHVIFTADWGAQGPQLLMTVLGMLSKDDSGEALDDVASAVFPGKPASVLSPKDLPAEVLHTVCATFDATRSAASEHVILAMHSCHPTVVAQTVMSRFASLVQHTAMMSGSSVLL
jgi:hypothetical protein